jgi:membrane dipeptidase
MIDELDYTARARDLVRDTFAWDNHACMPLRPNDDTFLQQIERHRNAGFSAVTVNVGFGENTVEDHVRMLAHFIQWFSSRPDAYVLAKSTDDLRRAREQRKLAVCFDIEGMCAVADQASLVSLYYELGVRWMLIAYNKNNPAGGGCQDADSGLTEFGRKVIDEMTRVGMMVCCSHTGYRTAREVIEYSPNPVLFSHSNPRALHDHPRNIPDDLMKACAQRGGLVGINGVGIFLGANDTRTETIARHIDYAVNLIGEDHVGLGLDYVFDSSELDDYMKKMAATFPAGMGYGAGMRLVEPERLTDITAQLMRLGYRDSTLRKILGGNLLRLAEQVWR